MVFSTVFFAISVVLEIDPLVNQEKVCVRNMLNFSPAFFFSLFSKIVNISPQLGNRIHRENSMVWSTFLKNQSPIGFWWFWKPFSTSDSNNEVSWLFLEQWVLEVLSLTFSNGHSLLLAIIIAFGLKCNYNCYICQKQLAPQMKYNVWNIWKSDVLLGGFFMADQC